MAIFKNHLGLRILVSRKIGLITLGLLISSSVLAWNATGHRVIAQIAYDHLSPHAKNKYRAYNRVLNNRYHSYDFVDSAVWLDKVRYSSDMPGEIHYIDIPFSQDPHLPLPKIDSINAVTALQQARSILAMPRVASKKRALALRVLVHLVGDIHQPLHAATRVSKLYPEGDKGGNLTKLPSNPVAETLHRYWDQGAGLLVSMDRKEIRRYANLLEGRWPCSFDEPAGDFDAWAKMSHELARREVYHFEQGETLQSDYQRRAMMISESQLATAGCRLANLLNHLDKEKLSHNRKKLATTSSG